MRGLRGQGFCFAVAALFGFWDLAFGDGNLTGLLFVEHIGRGYDGIGYG